MKATKTTGSDLKDRKPSCLCWITPTLAALGLMLAAHAQADEEFRLDANGMVTCLAIQADGKILAGGIFTELGGQARTNIARLNADGTVDAGFNPGANRNVYALAVQPDRKILVGGYFSVLGGQALANLGRLNADGSVDINFIPEPGGLTWSVIVQPDGKILAGGDMFIRRFNPDGTLDSDFNAGTVKGLGVWSLALQADRKIMVGGDITVLGGQPRNDIGRLNEDGTLDTTFNPAADASLYSLVVQADDKILVAGFFRNLAGEKRSRLGRLNPDGTLDLTFDPNPGVYPTNYVSPLALQADGKILAGGQFSFIGGGAAKGLGRVYPDGSIDTTFPEYSYDAIDSVAVQADGKIVASGLYPPFDGTRGFICRLQAAEPAHESLSYDGSTITWLRGGTSPEVSSTFFEYATNGVDWVNLGTGSRIAGGWQITGVELPVGTAIRGRGWANGGNYNASYWLVETETVIKSLPLRLLLDSTSAFSVRQFAFNVVGQAGCRVVIETTTDFRTWTGLYTNVLGAGPLGVSDPVSVNDSVRFYRARPE